MGRESELYQEFVELIGERTALAFIEEYAGRRLYIGNREEGKIASAMGQEVADALVQRYGRVYLRIPLARSRRAQIYRDQGLSNGKIATKLGISESGVDRILDRLKREGHGQ